MRASNYSTNRVFGLIMILVLSFLGEAIPNSAHKSSEEDDEVYIVYMGKTTSSVGNGDPRSDHAQLLNELNTRKDNVVVETYYKSFLGLAARLSKEEARSFAQRPQVLSVFPNRAIKLHTTRSWDFLMTQSAAEYGFRTATSISVPNTSTEAHDTVIGIFDTGISHKLPSFKDKDMSLIPPRWKGKCMSGENTTNKFVCNKKVIGARYYKDPHFLGSMTSPTDENGHGSHVASIAAGSPVEGTSYYGLAKGIARGGSPGSRIAVYRVCGYECSLLAVLKAFDDAIADGVNVISISMGLEYNEFFTDPISIGAFHAAEKGIVVVCSGGNSGPSPMTIENVAPWVITVAATTIDRYFESDIVLAQDKIKGGGINFSGLNNSAEFPLVDGRSARSNDKDVANASYCIPGSLDSHKVKGKIVVCDDEGDNNLLVVKIYTLKKQGATGIIVVTDNLVQIPSYHGTFLVTSVVADNGAQIRTYIKANNNPSATILPSATKLNYKPAPVVPNFSSRGPIKGIGNLIKPDVAAPGVGILAAWPPLNDEWVVPGKEPLLFHIASGTSMACPHVSGLAATVKSQHPAWSPSAIRSAIMTTAIETNNLDAPITTATESRATPYDIGAGEISIFGPLSPGLVYETETIDYIHFLCNLGYSTSIIKAISTTVSDKFECPAHWDLDLVSDMNYPSIAVTISKANRSRTVKRRVTNVGEEHSNYKVTVAAPDGVKVRVVPNKLQFTKNVKKLSFEVTFTLSTTTSFGEDLFGAITWSNRKYNVRSPFVVRSEASN